MDQNTFGWSALLNLLVVDILWRVDSNIDTSRQVNVLQLHRPYVNFWQKLVHPDRFEAEIPIFGRQRLPICCHSNVLRASTESWRWPRAMGRDRGLGFFPTPTKSASRFPGRDEPASAPLLFLEFGIFPRVIVISVIGQCRLEPQV